VSENSPDTSILLLTPQTSLPSYLTLWLTCHMAFIHTFWCLSHPSHHTVSASRGQGLCFVLW
jgi:hypothetical protein